MKCTIKVLKEVGQPKLTAVDPRLILTPCRETLCPNLHSRWGRIFLADMTGIGLSRVIPVFTVSLPCICVLMMPTAQVHFTLD